MSLGICRSGMEIPVPLYVTCPRVVQMYGTTLSHLSLRDLQYLVRLILQIVDLDRFQRFVSLKRKEKFEHLF
jgi:hypothetical protein